MVSSRLTRPNQSWSLALSSAFVDPSAPTEDELNDLRFVHRISCALTEDGTDLSLGDSTTDDTLTYCSVGSQQTPVLKTVTANITWLMDANTGGSGSTVVLTSLFNKVTAMLGSPDIPYWFISKTGPTGFQDADYVAGDVIKMARFTTDYPILTLENNKPVRGTQALLPTGDIAWNVDVVAS